MTNLRTQNKAIGALSAVLLALAALPAQANSPGPDPIPELPVSRRLCCSPVSVPGGQLTFLATGECAPVAIGTANGGPGATFNAGQNLVSFVGTHYIKVKGCSLKIVGANANDVTVNPTLPVPVNNEPYEVIPCATLNSTFGPNNEYGLTASGVPANADQILIAFSGSILTFHYDPGFPPFVPGQWLQVGGGSAGDLPLPPNAGMIMKRIPGPTLTIPVYGIARSGDQSLDIFPGLNLTSYPFYGNVCLGESDLQDDLVQSGVPANADLVQIEIGGAILSYHYDPGFPPFVPGQWLQVGGGNADNVKIPNGKSIIIRRQAAAGRAKVGIQEPLLSN